MWLQLIIKKNSHILFSQSNHWSDLPTVAHHHKNKNKVSPSYFKLNCIFLSYFLSFLKKNFVFSEKINKIYYANLKISTQLNSNWTDAPNGLKNKKTNVGDKFKKRNKKMGNRKRRTPLSESWRIRTSSFRL